MDEDEFGCVKCDVALDLRLEHGQRVLPARCIVDAGTIGPVDRVDAVALVEQTQQVLLRRSRTAPPTRREHQLDVIKKLP